MSPHLRKIASRTVFDFLALTFTLDPAMEIEPLVSSEGYVDLRGGTASLRCYNDQYQCDTCRLICNGFQEALQCFSASDASSSGRPSPLAQVFSRPDILSHSILSSRLAWGIQRQGTQCLESRRWGVQRTVWRWQTPGWWGWCPGWGGAWGSRSLLCWGRMGWGRTLFQPPSLSFCLSWSWLIRLNPAARSCMSSGSAPCCTSTHGCTLRVPCKHHSWYKHLTPLDQWVVTWLSLRSSTSAPSSALAFRSSHSHILTSGFLHHLWNILCGSSGSLRKVSCLVPASPSSGADPPSEPSWGRGSIRKRCSPHLVHIYEVG